MSAGQIPLGLQLAVSEPLGVRAYRRRFQSPMTNLQTAGPDDHVNIYFDTSTPGAFIDHESTYLSFDFQIENSEFCVDYTDFGVEGAAGALIQDWRVYNQGTILEEIIDYPTVASALANAEGAYELETTMYFSSKLKTGFQEDCHRNFIKPPMVSGSGNIMFGPNPFGLGIDAAMPHGEVPVYANASTAPASGVGIASGQLISNPSNGRITQGVLPTTAAFNAADSIASFTQRFVTAAGHGFPSFLGDKSATKLGPRLQGTTWNGHVSPALFPDMFSPSMVDVVRTQYVQEFGTINKTQVMANLCNVKCFPIGMIPQTNCLSSTATAKVITKTELIGPALTPISKEVAPLASNPTYRICYRPLSGIFGKMATKMLATTLLAPQQMYISLHLAQPHHVFNVSADPCRRIAGTIRDFVRNLGTRNGAAYGSQVFEIDTSLPNHYAAKNTDMASGYFPFATPFIAAGYSNLVSAAGCAGQLYITNQGSAAAENGLTLTPAVGGTNNWDIKRAGGFEGGQYQAPPMPQYALTLTPWKYNAKSTANTVIQYASESEVFYGTYLSASVPQSRRVFGKTITGSLNNALPAITYNITNMNLVGDQLILPNETTSDVILAAEAGNNNVSTNSVRTYQLQVRNDTTQSITLPIKVNMAKRIFIVFQDMEQRNSTLGFLHDSNCGINPFASVSSNGKPQTKPGFKSGIATTALEGVGMDAPIEYKFPKAGKNQDISVQLRIGNDFYPPQPLTTIQELSTEFVKCLEGWQDVTFSPDIDSRVVQHGTSAENLVFDCLQPSKYCTAFVPVSLLDDQTITSNPDFVPLYAQNLGTHSTLNVGGSAYREQEATIETALNGYNSICPRGYCVQGMFKSPSSRFMLGFNLRSFKDVDGVDGGTYLGNNTMTLLMTGCEGLAVSGRSYRGLAIVPHRAMMRYSPGGQIVWAY